MEQHQTSPQPPATAPARALPTPDLNAAIELVLGSPEALAEIASRAAPSCGRRDGWTPFARKLFLQVLAETGKISTACAYTGLSRRSAYDLQARDPLFAAGMAAASHLAREPLADTMREQAVDGVTDTITRNGEVVAERHRFDLRFAMSVLARLDKRCDRAEELGSKHLAAVRSWGEFLDLVGKGDEEAARAMLDSAPNQPAQPAGQCEVCEVPESAAPVAHDSTGDDLSECCWKAGSPEDLNPHRAGEVAQGTWITTFPPPPGFDGYESGAWDGLRYYERACTPEEAELLDANAAAAAEELRAEEEEMRVCAETERDGFFAMLSDRLGVAPAGGGAAALPSSG